MNIEVNQSRTTIFLCAVLFLDAVGFGLILPVLPSLIVEISQLKNSESAGVAGFLLVVFAMMQFVFAPILGGLSDKYGRRPILLIALLGYSLDYFLMAWAPSLFWIFIARITSGIFVATHATVNACIVDLTTKDRRAQFFGYAGASVGLGYVCGPAIGGVLGEYGTRIPFVVAGCLTMLTFIYGFIYFPETLSSKHRRAFSLRRANPLGGLIVISQYPLVLIILISVFIMQIANHSLSFIWPFYTIEILNWSSFQIGVSIAFYGLMIGLFQGLLTGPIVRKFGEVPVAIFGYIIGIVVFIGLGTATSSLGLYLWIFVGGFTALSYPVTQSLLTQNTPDNAQGELQGLLASSYSLTTIISALLMSQLFSHFSDDTGFYFPGAPFIAAAFLLVLSLFVFTFGVSRNSD